jgi:hypothetical protein
VAQPGRRRSAACGRAQIQSRPWQAQIHRSPDSYQRPGFAQSGYHHQRESIDAHLTIVFAALAVTRFIQARTGRPIKPFIRTARRCRTISTRGDQHILTA